MSPASPGRPRGPIRTGRAFLDDARDDGGVLAFAHRGGAYHPEIEGLENTLEAFEHAVALGYRYLETDVHVTADGVLLAFHDAVLDRVTDSRGEIARLTHAEVRRARVGGRAEVPTLDALFEHFPDVRFNIDIKAAGAVAPLAEFVARHRAHDRVLAGAFSSRRLREFRRRTAGRVATAASPAEVGTFLALPSGRLAGWLAGRFDALQVPRRHGRVPVATAGLLRRAHLMRKHVHVWTIDAQPEMHELLDLGVDGLFTDRTDLLKDVLTERGIWR